MICYPVIIPTLNRYEHFRQCVESLSKNTLADKTELIIGLDYPPSEKYNEGYERIKEYLPSISGFKKVTILERKENYGPYKNWMELKKYVFQQYDAVISTEDDNVFSPCFLDYVNKGLELFADDPKVTRVSGYNFTNLYDQGNFNVYLRPISCAWGVGEWREKNKTVDTLLNLDYFRSVLKSISHSVKIFVTNPTDLYLTIAMVKKEVIWDDVGRCVINILNNTYELGPAVSLVRNMGLDGSGDHGAMDYHNFYSTQVISEKDMFDFQKQVQSLKVARGFKLFSVGLPKSALRSTFYCLKVWGRYIKFRYTCK